MFSAAPAPNLTAYLSFLYGSVGIQPQFLPSDSGTATAGDANSLTDSTQSWQTDQWGGYTLSDLAQNAAVSISGNDAFSLSFTQPLGSAIASGDAYLIVPEVVAMSLDIAMETVNATLNVVSPKLYTLAVYNLATDRLINYADDVQDQTFFADKRKELRILDPPSGVVTSGSDEGTAANILNPEQAKLFTLQDLQTLKTPWGRRYMEIAQTYGRSIWGVT